jgi:gliding motility-associated-like protein
LEAGTYKVSISESSTSCSSTSEAKVVKIIDPASPDRQFNILSEGVSSLCEGDSLLLEAEGDFLEYKWSTGETTKTIKIKEGGNYSVEVKAGGGCTVSNEVSIDLLSAPEVVITVEKTTIRRGESIQLVASGADSYIWDASESISSANIPNPTVYPQVNTIYKVTGQSISGCIGVATIAIEVVIDNIEVKPHKIFTPNNDGIQDVWEIDNILDNPDLKVKIFNRAGVKLFEASPYTNNWDGTKNGKRLPYGDYYYIIDDPKSKKSKTGSFMLIR